MVICKDITLGTSMRLCAVVAAALGIDVGIIALIGSLVGLPVSVTLWLVEFSGIEAGIISVLLAPLVFAVGGALAGILVYPPLRLMLLFTGGLRLEGIFMQRY